MNSKILIADDSPTIQKVITLALSQEGYEIESASNGHELTEKISVFHPTVVLLDHELSGKTALDWLGWVRSKSDLNDIKIILMNNAFHPAKVDPKDFNAVLVKPFDPSQLRQAILSVLQAPPEFLPDFEKMTSETFSQMEFTNQELPAFDQPPPLFEENQPMESKEWDDWEVAGNEMHFSEQKKIEASEDDSNGEMNFDQLEMMPPPLEVSDSVSFESTQKNQFEDPFKADIFKKEEFFFDNSETMLPPPLDFNQGEFGFESHKTDSTKKDEDFLQQMDSMNIESIVRLEVQKRLDHEFQSMLEKILEKEVKKLLKEKENRLRELS